MIGAQRQHSNVNKTRPVHQYIYQQALLLYTEAQFVNIQALLMSESRMRRYQNRTFARVQGACISTVHIV